MRLALLAVVLALVVPTAAQAASLVRVQAPGAAALIRIGLDVTEQAEPGAVDVVLDGPGDEALLRAAGYDFVVRVPDLAAAEAAAREQDRRHARSLDGRGSALPSGRVTYRVYQDYLDDMDQLVSGHPGLVRPVTLALPSVLGTPIEGVEIATDVNATADGRPVYVVMGLHHAREWAAGEVTMEFAMTLANEYGTDARIHALLDKVRVFVIPVVNPDGFDVSRDNTDDLKRKNCGPDDAVAPGDPCGEGVDLNRNYGAYWGGAGASTNPNQETFRGPRPYSESESEAVHRFSSGLQIVTLITNHNYTASGYFLRQPGFASIGQLPDENRMKALGDSMAAATGYQSDKGYVIGDITGATEDWNYFAQGTFGYTPELRAAAFHSGTYADDVIGEYIGEGAYAGKGLREAFLRAGEQAADPQDHSVLAGTAPPGATLRITKSFMTPTSIAALKVPDTLESSLTVPAGGSFEWHVNPSTRPLSTPRSEAWTLTCELGGVVQQTTSVVVSRGERVSLTPCGGTPGTTPPPPPGATPPPPPAGTPAASLTRLLTRAVAVSARRANARRRFAVRVEARDGRVRRLRARFIRRGRTAATGSRSSLSGTGRITMRVRRRLVPGPYRLVVTGVDADGSALRAARTLRVRR